MGLHELIYKLVGSAGRVLETRTRATSRWRDTACAALPFLSWDQADSGELRHRAAQDDVLWMDVDALSGSEINAALQAFLESAARNLVAITVEDDDELTSLLDTLHGHALYAKAITAVTPADKPARAIVVNKLGNEDRARKHCQALSELAVIRYLDIRDTAELARLRKVVEAEQAQQWQVKAETLAERVRELASLVEEKGNQASLAQRQMLAHQARASQLRQSFSYRFGNLFVQAARNPKDLLLLPFRVMRLLATGAVNRIRRKRRARHQANTSPAARASKKPTEPAVATSPRFDSELQAFLRIQAADAGKATVAGILHPLTASLLSWPSGLAAVHPNTWKEDIANADVLLVDTFMQLAFTPWRNTLAGSPLAYPGHLLDVLEHCRTTGVPTVLLLTCAPEDYRELVDILPLFSHVIAPPRSALADLTRALTGKTSVLRCGWPAANAGNVADVGKRTRSARAVLSLHEGQVLVRHSEVGEPELLCTATMAANMDDVFGRPLVLEAVSDGQLDLRTFELLSKGAVPITPQGASFVAAHAYRFNAIGTDSAWRLADDEALCLEVARHNVIAASTHNAADQAIRAITRVAGLATPVAVRDNLVALVTLNDPARIPALAATFERQLVLPKRIVLFPSFTGNVEETKHSLAGRLPATVVVEVAEHGSSIEKRLQQGAGKADGNCWYALMDASRHYGVSHFAHVAALSLSGIAPAFAQLNQGKVDTTTLVVSSELANEAAALLQDASQEAGVVPPPGFLVAPLQAGVPVNETPVA